MEAKRKVRCCGQMCSGCKVWRHSSAPSFWRNRAGLSPFLERSSRTEMTTPKQVRGG
jgi:hypothetical protein